ncbi:MAG: hypothetical protein ACI9J3_003408 [Parvicellaceae bacterium]|jgi:hypothetical protein
MRSKFLFILVFLNLIAAFGYGQDSIVHKPNGGEDRKGKYINTPLFIQLIQDVS